MTVRDDIEEPYEQAMVGMKQVIVALREAGHADAATALTRARQDFACEVNRLLRSVEPRGRLVVRPIVPEHYSARPPLRSVPCGPTEPDYFALMERARADARRVARQSEKLLREVESEVPHAG